MTGLIRAIKPPSEMETPQQKSSALQTHQEKSSEVIIPVLQHGQLHFGSGDQVAFPSSTLWLQSQLAHGPH